MNTIVKTTTAPAYTWWYEYYFEPMLDKDGKVYTPFYYQDYSAGTGYPCYHIAVAYYGEKLKNPSFSKIGIKSFNGREVKKESESAVPTTDITSPIRLSTTGGANGYNSERKIGFYEVQYFDDFSIAQFRVDGGYEFAWSIPYVGDLYNNPNGFWNELAKLPKPKLPWEKDSSETGGGKGTYDDDNSDNISLPNLSSLNNNSINNTKFITLYKMSPTQLTHLADVLWSNNFMTQAANSYLKPLDFIISLQQFPIDVQGVTKNVKAGRFLLNEFLSDNPVQGAVISGQFARVDCGELEIKEKWGGAIDYQTDIQLFLPFIGTVSLSPQDVMASKIHIYYTVDLISGNCLASVLVKRGVLNSIIYQFNGNCSANYPITAENWSQVYSSLVSLSAGVAGVTDIGKSIASMPTRTASQREAQRNAQFNFGKMASEHIQGVGMEATGNLMAGAFTPSVQRTGALSSCVGFMGVKKPYLILSRLVQSLPKDFGYHKGYMSNVTKTLSDCKGFTQVRAMHLDNVIATVNEKDELLGLLQSGVIIK